MYFKVGSLVQVLGTGTGPCGNVTLSIDYGGIVMVPLLIFYIAAICLNYKGRHLYQILLIFEFDLDNINSLNPFIFNDKEN